MTARTDDEYPPIAHANPVTQAGFTMIANAVLLRGDLSPSAKLLYAYMSHLAWRNQSDVAVSPREQMALDLNISKNTITALLKELTTARTVEGDESAPPLVVTVRRGQGKTNLYVLNDPESVPVGLEETRKTENGRLEGQDREFPAGARHNGGGSKDSDVSKTKNEDGRDPPPVVHVGRRNVALDALCAATGVDEGSPRFQQAIVALLGRLDKRTDKVKEPGIRHLFWLECVRWAEEHDALDKLELAYDDPEEWAQALVKRIEQKAARYRTVYAGAAISPKALRDHWLDLELASAPRRGLTPDEIEHFDN